MTINIRRAGADETEVVAQVVRDSFQTAAERFGLTPENCAKHPSNCTPLWLCDELARGVRYYVATEGDGVVGCVALEEARPGLWYLERLAVLPDRRRRGIGRRLADHALSEARVGGAHRVSIGIIAEDVELKRWYARLGFVGVEEKNYPGLPFRVLLMELRCTDSAGELDGTPLESPTHG